LKGSTIAAVVLIVIVAVGGAAAYFLLSRPTGTLQIKVTDAPTPGLSDIYLSITDITLQGEGNSSTTFHLNATTIDILKLTNVTELIGSHNIPVGNYTMIRFNVTSATGTINGVNQTLTVPSGEFKVVVHPQIEIAAGKTTVVVLDITGNITNISNCGPSVGASCNLTPVVNLKQVINPT
jgi:uncharacterized protein DUF4382